MPTQWVKPKVALIHSGCKRSDASTNLAHYLGGCLALAGYSDVKLLRFDTAKGAPPPPRVPLMVVPPGAAAPNIPNERDLFFSADLDAVKECQVVVVCVDPPETEACGKRLAKLLPDKGRIGVFSLQHGCKNFVELKSSLDSTGNILVDGAVGFQVIRSALDDSLRVVAPGKIALARLSKEDADEGLKYVDLLQSSGIPMYFRKVMTPFTWGTLIAHTCDASNALTGDSMQEHLRDWRMRRVYAAMIRESCFSLSKAARSGGWAPDGSAAMGGLSLRQLELALCLPNWLFVLLSSWIAPVGADARSPTQLDLRARRETSLKWTLGELIDVGKRYDAPMPVASKVLELLQEAIARGDGVPMIKTEELYSTLGSPSASSHELRSLVLKIVAAILTIIIFFAMFDVLFPTSL